MSSRLTADQLQVTDLTAWVWPVTFRFRLGLPWGETTQVMTVDAPGVQGDIESSLKLSSELWLRAVAPATVQQCTLLYTDVVMWRFQPSALPFSDGLTRGLLAGVASPRNDTACAVFSTDHTDGMAFARFPIAGVPSRWVDDGLLTVGALDALECWGAAVLMGTLRHLVGSPMQLLLHYPRLLDPSSSNPSGVAFRRVERVFGMHHTRPAPVPSSEPWP